LTYDLIVIGSGPGGQRAAIQAAKAGKRVAIIESQSSVGGVCINTGTIPSKTMREAVLHLSGFYDKNFYGVSHTNGNEPVAMADLNFRVQHVVENEVGVIQDQLKRNGVVLIHGTGSFRDSHHIRVQSLNSVGEFEADYVVIATGTEILSAAIKFSVCRKSPAPSS
jgi:NAD(P) transhydrogenase